jgi:hypothetical protein
MFTMFTTFTPQMVIAGVQHQGGNCKQQARHSMALSARISVFHGEIDVSIGSGCSGLFFSL